MITDQPRAAIWRPAHHQYLEVIDAPPMTYHSPVHLHEDLEIGWKPRGAWNLAIRGSGHIITPETIVITPPEEAHKPTSGQDTEERYIGLRFQTDFLRTAAVEMSDKAGSVPFPASALFVQDAELRQNLEVLHRGLVNDRLTRLEEDGLIQQLLTRMLRHTAHLPDPRWDGREDSIVQKTRDYIRDHYQDALSLQDLAQHVHMSAFHLNRIFTTSVGIPPHAYQIQIRISQAKRLLTQGYPIAEVALRTGFASQSHFGECFKRLVSITPGQYLAAAEPRQTYQTA